MENKLILKFEFFIKIFQNRKENKSFIKNIQAIAGTFEASSFHFSKVSKKKNTNESK